MTLFQQITVSEEELAPLLVCWRESILGEDYYISTVLAGRTFRNRKKAVAATVAELKKEINKKGEK